MLNTFQILRRMKRQINDISLYPTSTKGLQLLMALIIFISSSHVSAHGMLQHIFGRMCEIVRIIYHGHQHK